MLQVEMQRKLLPFLVFLFSSVCVLCMITFRNSVRVCHISVYTEIACRC